VIQNGKRVQKVVTVLTYSDGTKETKVKVIGGKGKKADRYVVGTHQETRTVIQNGKRVQKVVTVLTYSDGSKETKTKVQGGRVQNGGGH